MVPLKLNCAHRVIGEGRRRLEDRTLAVLRRNPRAAYYRPHPSLEENDEWGGEKKEEKEKEEEEEEEEEF
jgi:hypothetical protein